MNLTSFSEVGLNCSHSRKNIHSIVYKIRTGLLEQKLIHLLKSQKIKEDVFPSLVCGGMRKTFLIPTHETQSI